MQRICAGFQEKACFETLHNELFKYSIPTYTRKCTLFLLVLSFQIKIIVLPMQLLGYCYTSTCSFNNVYFTHPPIPSMLTEIK
jgi:hypothetical protein